MKKTCMMMFMCISFCSAHSINKNVYLKNNNYSLEGLSLSTTTTWQEFHMNNEYFEKENCAWLSSITFKSKNSLKLRQLQLNWNGTIINTHKIGASLYSKKDTSNVLIPLKKNLISDGTWDKNNQKILFLLNEKLIATNKYYLVISFPENIKQIVKNGFFDIDDDYLKIEYN